MSAFPVPSAVVRFVNGRVSPGGSSLDVGAVAARAIALEAACHRWLVAYSIAILRISVGAVFLGFGMLKFFPGVSPAESLVQATTHILTFGLVPGGVALVGVAVLETAIGLCLLLGRGMRAAIYLLVVQMGGILSPIMLLPGRLFSGAGIAPTLEGQYVLKDIIIVGAALVLAASVGGARLHGAAGKPANG
jgi:uncharacterized membrane protein YphA (DoxX/SURF4 family)